MSETAEKAALPPYVVPAPPTGDVGSIEDVSQALRRLDPSVELWSYEHPKTADWVLYRPATTAQIGHYRKTTREQAARGDVGNVDLADTELVFGCVVFPAKDDLIRLLAKRPFIGRIIAGEITEVSGYDGAATSKKV